MDQPEEIKEIEDQDLEAPVSDSDELNQPGSEIDSSSSDDAESGDGLNRNIIWQEKTTEFLRDWTPQWLKSYTEQAGPKNFSPDFDMEMEESQMKLDEIKCFSKKINNQILDHIAMCTNEYYETYMKNLEDQHKFIPSYLKNWSNLDRMDVLLLISCHLYMGINRLPSVRDYWKKNFLYMGSKIIDVVSRQKFELWQRFLHVAKSSTIDSNSPMSRVNYLSSLLIYNYQKYYTLCPEI